MDEIVFDKKTALALVSKTLAEKAPPGQPWAIAENRTRETASAWIFFYNSQRYFETGNVVDMLAGNGPVFVNKMTGQVELYGSAQPLNIIIEKYEKS